MKKFTVTLTKDERAALKQITCKGKHKSQKVLPDGVCGYWRIKLSNLITSITFPTNQYVVY